MENKFLKNFKNEKIFDVLYVVFNCRLLFLVLWHINLCRLSNTKSIFIQINNSISNNSV